MPAAGLQLLVNSFLYCALLCLCLKCLSVSGANVDHTMPLIFLNLGEYHG